MELLIYSPKRSPRLDYILEFIFKEVLLCDFRLTSNLDAFKSFRGARINYSNEQAIPNCVNIVSHSLLFEDDNVHDLHCTDWNGLPAFFKTSFEEIPFDIFSASFYLISRYEEYESNEQDEFRRFPHEKSMAFQNNFLQLPLVDLWLLELKKILERDFPDLKFEEKRFKFIPTYDIDIAFSYKNKGLLRNIGGALRDLYQGKFRELKNRTAVLRNKEKDPYDSFEFLDNLHKEYQLAPIYFFLLGNGGPFDKNISVNKLELKELIQRISKSYEVGIHPSYRSNDEDEELNIEVQRLNTIASIQTTKSRQHYIRFALPHNYHKLIEQSITEDYSMGYGSINGFRASTTQPFQWFDLSKNKKTELKIFPFCFMECNSFFEQKQSIDTTKKEIEHYIDIVKKVNGTFISIWHNFSLGTDPIWEGWKELYLHQINTIKRT